MFILTDGKNYVMENPMKSGEYMITTSSSMAKEFTYKQARSLVQNSRKKYSWIKKYNLIDVDTGQKSDKSLYYRGNANVYIGDESNFDYALLDKINSEANSILGLNNFKRREIIKLCNIVVDGEYIDEQKDLTLRWRGSKNQRVIDVKQSLAQNKMVLYCE